MINKLKTLFFISFCSIIFFPSCEIEEVLNPNAPSVESLENGATLADLQLLANGLQAAMRNDMEYYYWTTSIVGREYYDLNNVDPRYTGELIGRNGAQLDNNGFLTTRGFAAAYYVARNVYTLINATKNSAASLSATEENGIVGFAETVRAYHLLLEANRQYNNGIRLDTEDPNNPGPFTADYQASLAGIASILDNANTLLFASGTEFVFDLTSGFAGLNTPTEFSKFNRAVAARIALYRGNNSDALTLLDESFMDLTDINPPVNGVYNVFGAGGNDRTNPLFNVSGADLYMAHDSFEADAEADDLRVYDSPTNDAKVTLLESTEELPVPVTADNLSGSYQVSIYPTNTTPVPLIRNEELILIYAEANIGSNNALAENAINLVRINAGIGNYGGASDDASLTTEVLRQRRYSLFGEGHRWVDMRRYDLLGDLPNDREGDQVFESFPRPILEVN